LKNDDHFVINHVNERIEAVTGLEMDTAEDLQVTIDNIYMPYQNSLICDETFFSI